MSDDDKASVCSEDGEIEISRITMLEKKLTSLTSELSLQRSTLEGMVDLTKDLERQRSAVEGMLLRCGSQQDQMLLQQQQNDCRVGAQLESVMAALSEMQAHWAKVSPVIAAGVTSALHTSTPGMGSMPPRSLRREDVTIRPITLDQPPPDDGTSRPITPDPDVYTPFDRSTMGVAMDLRAHGQAIEMKVPKFDGRKMSLSAWYLQFRLAASGNRWNDCEKAMYLLASLEGTPAMLMVGLSDSQLSNFSVLIEKLKARYDPAHRERTYRAQFRARNRRRGEDVDEYAECIQILAQKAFPNQGQGNIDEFVIDRFIEGQMDVEVRRHLMVSFREPQHLEDLVGAVITYEATIPTTTRMPQKPDDGMYALQSELSYNELAELARKMGYGLRPWVDRRQSEPSRAPQQQQQRQPGSDMRRAPRDFSKMTCWNCGKVGHTQHVCKDKKSGLRFAPQHMRVNMVAADYSDNCSVIVDHDVSDLN